MARKETRIGGYAVEMLPWGFEINSTCGPDGEDTASIWLSFEELDELQAARAAGGFPDPEPTTKPKPDWRRAQRPVETVADADPYAEAE